MTSLYDTSVPFKTTVAVAVRQRQKKNILKFFVLLFLLLLKEAYQMQTVN